MEDRSFEVADLAEEGDSGARTRADRERLDSPYESRGELRDADSFDRKCPTTNPLDSDLEIGSV